MRFKRKYNDNDTRTVTKFLWFPKIIHGETRWLEKVTYVERYTLTANCPGWWSSVKWVD